jgi:SAM-dependent methyltransferase
LYHDAGPEILDALSLAPKFNRWMADTIAPYLGERILEIGAGTGNLTRNLAPRRKFYAATDISTEYLERLRNKFRRRPNLEVRRCDVENADEVNAFDQRVDTVVCLNVIEHVRDDVGSMRRLHSILQPGGRAIILVPCGQEIFGTLDTALGHYRRYSREELRSRMEDAGFRVERVLEFNRVSRPGWYFTGRVLKGRTISRFQLRAFDKLVWLWRRVDAHLPWDPTSVIAIGRKDI